MDRKKIEQRAEKVLQAFQYYENDSVYVDAVLLARFFGFSVDQKDMPANEDGCISVSKDGSEKSIEVNDNRSFETKRFIIVHELAHYLLHYNGNEELFKHRENTKGKNLEENDADYLAACLLMPQNRFKEQYNKLRNEKNHTDVINELQFKFRTPRESVERRILEVCR